MTAVDLQGHDSKDCDAHDNKQIVFYRLDQFKNYKAGTVTAVGKYSNAIQV